MSVCFPSGPEERSYLHMEPNCKLTGVWGREFSQHLLSHPSLFTDPCLPSDSKMLFPFFLDTTCYVHPCPRTVDNKAAEKMTGKNKICTFCPCAVVFLSFCVLSSSRGGELNEASCILSHSVSEVVLYASDSVEGNTCCSQKRSCQSRELPSRNFAQIYMPA